MPLPPGVTTCTLTFGPYVNSVGAPAYVGMRGKITPSAQVLHAETGAVIVPHALTVTLDETGHASIALPHTDLAALTPVGFTYEVTWGTHGFRPCPGDRRIALPAAVGGTQDFDVLAASPATPGVVVPVIEGPRGPEGPAGPQGPRGPAGSGSGGSSGDEFTQATPAATWSFAHALGRKPVVSIYLDGEEVEADVYASATQVVVQFPSPRAGTVTLA